ncbi:hypothetical protein BZG36_01281 [Bifiguratus adelaidae]|uniref:dihydrolipoyllysine-residue succinyltransferase n=1 Tax=Bifiguratus adelaidae TaxID=1938954 RepID=A0A261Y551_9FUNG|nr:hypothetical protein BZG36_01281 [Bifiguratus adelaidae]
MTQRSDNQHVHIPMDDSDDDEGMEFQNYAESDDDDEDPFFMPTHNKRSKTLSFSHASRTSPLLARAVRSARSSAFNTGLKYAAGARALHLQVPAATVLGSSNVVRKSGLTRQNVFGQQVRFYADKMVQVPHMADSISEGTLKTWVKKVGDFVKQDEEVATIETDKVDISVNAPASGTITETFANEEDTVSVGADLFKMELGDAPSGDAAKKEESSEQPKEIEARDEPKTKEEPKQQKEKPKPAPQPVEEKPAPKQAPAADASSAPSSSGSAPKVTGSREERRVKMNRMRLRIAERLKESQNNAASLTTFNEVDMSNLMQMRSLYKEDVWKKHGIKLGFMSAFAKASCVALQELPAVNGSIEGDSIVYHDYVDLSVAVATPKGLVTPVLRNVEDMSFIDIEQAIAELGKKARDNKITIEDMAGGTFTISNGGIFGSMMGTPIINLPQSAILGMHAIKERPVAVNGKVEIRPMMYIALTYDHRIIDGREAVTFLVKVKNLIEDPRRLLLDI